MKKIYSLFVIAAGCLIMASCGDDNDYEPKTSSVSVVSAETELAAAGESKTIVVNGTGLSASFPSSATWISASVSGNNITVTAEPNLNNETRHALLTVRASNGDETSVSFSQFGAIFSIDAPPEIHLTDDSQTIELDAKFNLPLTVSTSDDWLSVRVDEANSKVILTASANNTGNMRFGDVDYSIGNVQGSFSVEQWDFAKDVLGQYYLWYYTGSWNYTNVALEQSGRNVRIRLLDDGYAEYGLVIPTTTDSEYLTMTIDNLAPMGSVTLSGTTYQALAFVRGLSGSSIYRSRSAWAMEGAFYAYSDGTFGWQYDGNSVLTASYSWYGLSIGLTSDGTYDGYAGWYTPHFYYMELERVDPSELASAKGPVKVKQAKDRAAKIPLHRFGNVK
ncbi:MAG: BACON domain-containing protein [Prevotella sp.]|nr:BACON domain-containing protein [Prevotella sp.]